MASLTELSFNWLGFISAMISNISFTYRSIFSKKAMVLDSSLFFLTLLTRVKFWFWNRIVFLQTDMDSTNVYAYISIIALFVCIPPAIIVKSLSWSLTSYVWEK